MIGTGKQHSKWICWLTCTFLLLTGMVVSAVAGPVQVWVQPSGDTFAKAYVITGESRTYFGRVEGGGGSYEYKWEFSDGVATSFAAVSDPRYISYDKIFTSAGTQWAKLTVRDASDTSNSASAQINLQVIAAASDNLNRQKNSAIDRGLRYTYRQEDVGCAGYSSGATYFSNSGANEAYIYGWTEGLQTTLRQAYFFGPTVVPGTFTIDWGDGNVETVPGLDWYASYPYAYIEYIYHTYATAGTYTISISHDGTATNPFISADAIATGSTTGSQSCWSGSGFPFGSTGMALIAFENHGHNLQAPDSDIFKKSVQNGIQFILNNAAQETLADQPYIGDPKANGSDTINDHLGVYFGSTNLYEASIAYMALVNSADEAFSKTALANTGNAINGLSFWDIAVDAADWLAWAQSEGSGRGGWRYGPNSDSSDGSVTQWPVLALSEAKNRWNIHVNPLVIDELNIWLNAIQAADGSFGYDWYGNWNNFPKTAAGLIQFKYAGRNHSDASVQNAESYVNNTWIDMDASGTYMYSAYAFYKAMKIWGITNFYGRNWEELYDQALVNHQAVDNTWGDNDGWEDRSFATYSALAILAPEVASLPPVANAGGPYPSINPGQALALDGSHSYHQDPAKSIVTWQWDFDASNGLWWDAKAAPDAGEGATGLAPSVSYPDLGHDQSYTVTLRVIDNTAPEALTDTDTVAISVTTGNVAPVPVTNGPWSGLPGVPILFDGSASYDPNACTTAGDPACLGDSIVSYEWDLDGDGLYNEANGDDGAPVVAGNYSQVTKSFSTPVSLSARLRVTDEFGLTATSSDSLNVVSIAIVFGQQYNICYRVAINRYEDRMGIQVKFKNEGNAPAENLVMELKNTPSNMTILKSTSDLGTLGAGAEAFTACDPTAKVADIELRTNRLIKPTGGWIWRATFQFNGQSYTVDGIPPLAP